VVVVAGMFDGHALKHLLKAYDTDTLHQCRLLMLGLM
jgi:hypothetical protein